MGNTCFSKNKSTKSHLLAKITDKDNGRILPKSVFKDYLNWMRKVFNVLIISLYNSFFESMAKMKSKWLKFL